MEKYMKKIISLKSIKLPTFKTNSWCYQLTKSNFIRRRKRNLFSIFGLIVGLVSSMLIIGFAFGHKESIKSKSYSQFNFGVATIYKQTTQNISGSKMALVQMSKLSANELEL